MWDPSAQLLLLLLLLLLFNYCLFASWLNTAKASANNNKNNNNNNNIIHSFNKHHTYSWGEALRNNTSGARYNPTWSFILSTFYPKYNVSFTHFTEPSSGLNTAATKVFLSVRWIESRRTIRNQSLEMSDFFRLTCVMGTHWSKFSLYDFCLFHFRR
jgi:outer membrane receptor for ferrienterochelin and colicin